MMIEQSKRNPSLELLRIISMFMIIMLHCLLHGGILKEYSFNDYHYIVIWLIESLCMVSVNVFLLISGYFGYQIGFRLITVVKFYCEVFLYSLVSIGIASFITELSIKEIILSLFPFTSSRYWFATNYILLLLLQPFVNFFIKSLDQLLYKRLIIVLVIVFSGLATVLYWFQSTVGKGTNIVWFIIVYFIGAYLKKYRIRFTSKALYWYFIFGFLQAFFCWLIPFITNLIFGSSKGPWVINYYNNIFIFSSSVCLFGYFLTIDNVKSRILNIIALGGRYIIGAYLISDHASFRAPFWDLVNIKDYLSGSFGSLLLYMIYVDLSILIIGLISNIIIKSIIRFALPKVIAILSEIG